MAIYQALAVAAVPQTALVVDKAVDIVGSFAHFVRTALVVVGTVVVAVELAVPTADSMVAQAVGTADIAQLSLAAHGDHWDRTVDNSCCTLSLH
jgi:hypothetical protein